MRRRGKTRGKVAKTQRRKTLGHRNVPKTVHRVSLPLAKKTDAKRLTRELEAALEQQIAMAEVLRVISSSPTNIEAVLDMVSENAARLCDANNCVICSLEGDRLRVVTQIGQIPTSAVPRAGIPVNRGTVNGRAVLDRRTIHIHDLAAEDGEFPEGSRYAKVDGFRTTLATPLLREGIPIGTILIRRTEVRPFLAKADRSAGHLRLSGRHCHRERASAQRAARISSTADRHRRGAQSDQQFAGRTGAGLHSDARKRSAHLRRRFWCDVQDRQWRA